MKSGIEEFFKKSEILRPSVLLLIGTLAFVSLAPNALSIKAYGIIVFSLAFFYAGERFSEKTELKFNPEKKSLLYFGAFLSVISLAALNFNFFTAGGFPVFNPALVFAFHCICFKQSKYG